LLTTPTILCAEGNAPPASDYLPDLWSEVSDFPVHVGLMSTGASCNF
jgi:hypothetical protein